MGQGHQVHLLCRCQQLNQPLRYYQGEKDRTMQVEYYGVKLQAGFKLSF